MKVSALLLRSWWPKCGARVRRKGRGRPALCTEPAAPHARNPAYPCPSHRCRLHGGVSTGPRTAEGRSRIAAAARRMWEETLEAEGLIRPTSELREALGAFLETRTWVAAMELTGLSRRALERVERGAYCSREELREVATAVRVGRQRRRRAPASDAGGAPTGARTSRTRSQETD